MAARPWTRRLTKEGRVMRTLSRTGLVVVAAIAALAVGASVAVAAAPQFKAATSSVNNDGALVVSFDERGLGNGNIDYTLSADATAVFACINGGGKHPQATNKETVNA